MENKKILVVDDEDIILQVFDMALTQAGYEVVVARSGEEALSILANENFSVIFSDLSLPEMNGLDLCRMIKLNTPDSYCCAITAFSSPSDIKQCFDAGFNNYISKPVKLTNLVEAANSAFEFSRL